MSEVVRRNEEESISGICEQWWWRVTSPENVFPQPYLPTKADMIAGLLLTPADLRCSYKVMCYIKVMQ